MAEAYKWHDFSEEAWKRLEQDGVECYARACPQMAKGLKEKEMRRIELVVD